MYQPSEVEVQTSGCLWGAGHIAKHHKGMFSQWMPGQDWISRFPKQLCRKLCNISNILCIERILLAFSSIRIKIQTCKWLMLRLYDLWPNSLKIVAHQTCEPMVRQMLWSLRKFFRIMTALGCQGSLHWLFESIRVGQVQVLRHDSLAVFATCLKGGWPRPVHTRSSIPYKAFFSIPRKCYAPGPRWRQVAANRSNLVKCK